MLELRNVSKFYYNKGIIASGFSKVNVKFDIGEFVVITGESGSGKSTLLNVISGLDSYEEGEMYINGKETSHYSETDFENYRRKYVSNIFQSFNLVNSYTVYQNVELILLINGYRKKEIKNRVLELIKQVNLTKYKNTKVSKLSGGQKQRVAIARALAKETPIIVCDEATANLDSKASKEVIDVLKKISKNKLVIMVTHDFLSVKDIATRVVNMSDGRIISDKKINDLENSSSYNIEVKDTEKNSIGIFNILRLGIRNTFNIFLKFILMFCVFLFITVSLLSLYSLFKMFEENIENSGLNYYFDELDARRIIINKKDNLEFNDNDFNKIREINGVNYIYKDDLLTDTWLQFRNKEDSYEMYSYVRDLSYLFGELDYGRMPSNDYEVVLEMSRNSKLYKDVKLRDEYLSQEYFTGYMEDNINGSTLEHGIKIVGIKYSDKVYGDEYTPIYYTFYGRENFIKKLSISFNSIVTNDTYVVINGRKYLTDDFYGYRIYKSSKVPTGYAYMAEENNYLCKRYNCLNEEIRIDVENLYYQDSVKLKVKKIYNQDNVKKILGINKNSDDYGKIFINENDYDKLYDKGIFQSSIFVDDVRNLDYVSSQLESMGYNTLQIRDTYSRDNAVFIKIFKIVELIVISLFIITLFFISYFVIKLILKSRNVYYSTLRILGATLKDTKRILDVELIINASLSYFIFIFGIFFVNNYFKVKFISNLLKYLSIREYVLVYIILILMSYLIAIRFSGKIFKKSALNAYREEV